ncbi:MAG: hypothetical protein ACT4O1_10350 [Gemmatimonadota bacterium]
MRGWRLAVFGICALLAYACGGEDVDIETLPPERQTVSLTDDVVQLMATPDEPLVYDKPVDLAKPAPQPDTMRPARDTAR